MAMETNHARATKLYAEQERKKQKTIKEVE